MALWGNTDTASNSCIFVPAQVNLAPTRANANNMFDNQTEGAFVANKVVGQFGVSVTEIANTSGEGNRVTHSGWSLRTAGTGSLVSLVVSAGGAGYSNTDVISVVPSSNGTNATATVATNANGVITAVTVTNTGVGFQMVHPANVVIKAANGSNSAGSNAVLVATAGGRAGRVNYECLVAMGTIQGDANTDNTILPGT